MSRFLARLALVPLLTAATASADVRLPAVFGDHMVLQAEREVALWGWADQGEEVRVEASWSSAAIPTRVGVDGRFEVTLETPAAGGPHTVTVIGRNRVVLEDVLVGEVWLCSGQSNMEMSVSGAPPGTFGVIDEERELAAADWPDIRLFLVENAIAPSPLVLCKGRWRKCSPESVAAFSAAGYFFGRELHTELGVPVGLIAADWGGTVVESWTSREGLREFPEFEGALAAVERVARDLDGLAREGDEQRATFWERLAAADPLSAAGAQAPDFDDASWRSVDLPALWEEHGLPGVDGVVWFRREVELPAEWAGQALSLELGGIDDMDSTWFEGQHVGGLEGPGHWRTPRFYEVPAELVRAGRATIAVRAVDTGGAGGFNGLPEHLKLRRADGEGAPLSLAGAWRMAQGAGLGDLPTWPRMPGLHANQPTALFNGMIAPLVPYGIRGAIWYQGESNRPRAHQYRSLFPAMIADWRARWGSELPFYYVQIAPFAYGGDRGEAAELREAQLLALRVPNTGMAVTMDVGDPRDIHPKDKQTVGKRLALCALAGTYGREVEHSGPRWRGMVVEGAALRLEFDHADGLVARGGPPTCFQIAGVDRRFHPADARVAGATVVVSSPEVPLPVAVRFAWGAADEPNLFNAAGLPASSFRTDDWPAVTRPSR